jgi:hypothetical protein
MSSSQTLPPPEGPEYTPCACSHIEPEHDVNGRWCAINGCQCSLYRPTPAAPAGTPRPVQHAPGKAILCPSCRDKGHSVCMAEQAAAVQQPEEAR